MLEVGPILCQQQPDEFEGHIHLATALHALNRTAEAREVLLKVVDKFPSAYPIPFALACYACRLGNIEEARRWWNKARALTNNKDKLEELARTERDLQALWEGES